MKTMMRFATAAFVTLNFVGCEGEAAKPSAPAAGETKPSAPTKPVAPSKGAKTAAPTSSPDTKTID